MTADVLQARYTHGPGIDDPAMAERDLDASGSFEAAERVFFHTDGLGSATELSDATGAVAGARVYDAYGRIVQETGAAIAQPYAFTGREFDAESVLYYDRARYYDPATGRFLSEDPLGFAAGDANLYRYVFNNPINLRDPTGRIIPLLAIALGRCAAGGLIGAIAAVDGFVAGSAARITADALADSDDTRSCSASSSLGLLPGSSGPSPARHRSPKLDDLANVAALGALTGCLSGGLSTGIAALGSAAAGVAESQLFGEFVGGLVNPSSATIELF